MLGPDKFALMVVAHGPLDTGALQHLADVTARVGAPGFQGGGSIRFIVFCTIGQKMESPRHKEIASGLVS